MRPEPGGLERAGAASDLRIRVTWLESTVAPEAPPARAAAAEVGPGWAPYVLAGIAGVLLLLATVAWPLWQPVGLWLGDLMQTGPRH